MSGIEPHRPTEGSVAPKIRAMRIESPAEDGRRAPPRGPDESNVSRQ
jgi:hypothetical protein